VTGFWVSTAASALIGEDGGQYIPPKIGLYC